RHRAHAHGLRAFFARRGWEQAMKSIRAASAGLFAAVLGAACGDRPDIYNAPVDKDLQAFALTNGVAVVDRSGNRTLILTPRPNQQIERTFVPIGKTTVHAEVSPDQQRLFVLSAGDIPRRKDKNEKPSLTVIQNAAGHTYPLESPHSGF